MFKWVYNYVLAPNVLVCHAGKEKRVVYITVNRKKDEERKNYFPTFPTR